MSHDTTMLTHTHTHTHTHAHIRARTHDETRTNVRAHTQTMTHALKAHRRNHITRKTHVHTWCEQVEVYDFRWYVHNNGVHPTASEILALAEGETTPGIPDASLKCLPPESDTVLDANWLDAYGNGCEWYAVRKQRFPSVCQSNAVRAACPLTCGQFQECFPGQVEAPKPYFVWDRIRRIEGKTDNGTLCLGDTVDKETIVQNCRDFFGRDPSTLSAEEMTRIKTWASMYTDLKTRKLNVTDCDTLAEAVNNYCSFDMAAIEDFTSDLKKSNGDFTLAFWIRPHMVPDPAASLHTDGKFYPHITLYSGLSPPTHHLSWGLWYNSDGESRLFSSCGDKSATLRQYENVELVGQVSKKLRQMDAWAHIAYTPKM